MIIYRIFIFSLCCGQVLGKKKKIVKATTKLDKVLLSYPEYLSLPLWLLDSCLVNWFEPRQLFLEQILFFTFLRDLTVQLCFRLSCRWFIPCYSGVSEGQVQLFLESQNCVGKLLLKAPISVCSCLAQHHEIFCFSSVRLTSDNCSTFARFQPLDCPTVLTGFLP